MQRTIRLFYTNPDTGLLETRLEGSAMEQITGVQVLLEKIAKLLYTSTQSNHFSPGLGSPIGDKSMLSISDKMNMELTLHDSIKRIEGQVILEQATEGTNFDPDQQLVSLEISNIYQGEDPTTWYVEVIVRTTANQSYFITV